MYVPMNATVVSIIDIDKWRGESWWLMMNHWWRMWKECRDLIRKQNNECEESNGMNEGHCTILLSMCQSKQILIEWWDDIVLFSGKWRHLHFTSEFWGLREIDLLVPVGSLLLVVLILTPLKSTDPPYFWVEEWCQHTEAGRWKNKEQK